MIIDHDARERQTRYFDALRTLPKIKIILGAFQPREVTCRASCKQKYEITEEKKTDVNIAVEMLSDAFCGACDAMCIVSGDSDIQPAVEWVARNRRNVEISVFVPSLPNERRARRTDYYLTRGLPVQCEFLPLGSIKEQQLPVKVRLGQGRLAIRPTSWTAPGSTAAYTL